MTKNIKVAVIGAGMMGKNHMKTYKSLNGVELVGVYDIFPEAAKAAAETFGIRAFSSMEEVAENVDAVSVVTTSVTHADVGEFFLNKGIHCMMEKPLACTEEECQRLISAADKTTSFCWLATLNASIRLSNRWANCSPTPPKSVR